MQANNNSFLYQEKCAHAAKDFYTTNDYSKNNSLSDGYISHYNKSLNKCFIEFSNGLGNSGTDIFYELADAVEGIEYGEIKLTYKPNEKTLGWCTLYTSGNRNSTDSNSKSCNSKTEFDNFVKPYMND